MIPTRLIALSFAALLTGLSVANARPQMGTEAVPDNNGHWTTQGQIQATGEAPRKSHKRTARAAKPRIDAHGNDGAAIGSGVIRSHKTGATARVSAHMAPLVQAMIDDLEQNYGSAIYFIGGYRSGSCSLASQHPCGDAADICQRSRGVVDPKCKLPNPATFNKVARAHNLYEGSVWCHGDYGHVQRRYSGGCNGVAHGRGGVQLATITGKIVVEEVSVKIKHRRHKRVHYARKIQSVSAY